MIESDSINDGEAAGFSDGNENDNSGTVQVQDIPEPPQDFPQEVIST